MDKTLIRCYHSGPGWTWERWQWRGTPHSPKLQHCWNLTIRLFSVILPGHSFEGGGSYPSAEKQSVYSVLGNVALDSHFSLTTFSEPLIVWPNTSSKGVKPRESWTDSLAAKRTRWTPTSQSLWYWWQNIFIMDFRDWWKRSRGPCNSGWLALDTYCLMPSLCIICWNKPDIKLDPWFYWTDKGMPTKLKNFVRAFALWFDIS